MSLQHDVVVVLLGCTVACCWVGALGMWKMRTPTQSLHYLSLPCSLGIVVLAAAVVVQEGFGQVGLKTLLIAVLLLGFNTAVTHATARAIRIREIARKGQAGRDPMGFDKIAAEEQ